MLPVPYVRTLEVQLAAVLCKTVCATVSFSAGTEQRLAAASLQLSLCIPSRCVEGSGGIAPPIINVGIRCR